MNEILGADVDTLGARKKRAKASKLNRLANILKQKARRKAKKPAIRALWQRLSPSKKREVIAKAVKQNPKLKRKLAAAVIKRRIEDRKDGLVTSPGEVEHTSVPRTSPAVVTRNPTEAPIPTDETVTSEQAVEEEMEQSALDNAANEETASEENAENAVNEAAEDSAAKAESDAEEMSEETPEESAEEQEQVTEDAAKAMAEASGSLILGYLSGKRRIARRHKGDVKHACAKALPLARQIEQASGGEIKAAHLLGAVKLIKKAKKGDVKAKKGIKAVTKLAAKKGPKQKAAKKATAKLKIAHQIMKKTGTAKGTPKVKKAVSKKIGKPAPYGNKVMVRNTGLYSYSAYQRGMAQIPGFARSHYGS